MTPPFPSAEQRCGGFPSQPLLPPRQPAQGTKGSPGNRLKVSWRPEQGGPALPLASLMSRCCPLLDDRPDSHIRARGKYTWAPRRILRGPAGHSPTQRGSAGASEPGCGPAWSGPLRGLFSLQAPQLASPPHSLSSPRVCTWQQSEAVVWSGGPELERTSVLQEGFLQSRPRGPATPRICAAAGLEEAETFAF